jgi:hypothetical protein
VFYLNSQQNKNFRGSFHPDQEKACNIGPFQGGVHIKITGMPYSNQG